MRSYLLALAALSVFTTTPTFAQERALIELTGMKGTCEALSTPDTQLTDACHWAVMSLGYNDGRRSFSFFSGPSDDQTLYAFSGMPDLTTVGDDNTVTMAVDRLFTGKATTVTPIEVSGECRFTWPLTGVVTVDCTATAPTGSYSGRFVSNGEAPVVTPLP